MTWDSIAGATNGRGSGAIAFRLVIGGLPAQAVSSLAMENTSADPPRYRGLSMAGFRMRESVDPVRARIKADGFTAAFVEAQYEQTWTSLFAAKPTRKTWLNASITNSGTTLTVLDTSLFPTSGTLWLDAEAMTYSGKTSTTFTGLDRGELATYARAHYVTGGRDLRYPEVTDRPTTLLSQRVKVFAYGSGDDPQGNGTLIWQGIVAGDPSFDGMTWSMLIDPITSVMSQELSADLAEPTGPRGIYFPGTTIESGVIEGSRIPAQYQLQIEEATSTIWGGPSVSVTVRIPESPDDETFWETQEDFCEFLNTKIVTAMGASFQGTLKAVSDGADGYHFQVRTGATARYLSVSPFISGPCDPRWDPILRNAAGDTVEVVSTNTDYYVRPGTLQDIAGPGTVPRGVFYPGVSAASSLASATPSRIYLAGAVGLESTIGAALIDWNTPSGERAYAVTTITAADRSVELFRDYSSGPGDGDGRWPAGFRVYTRDAPAEIRLGRNYGSGSAYDFLVQLNTVADSVNQGGAPDVRFGFDFDSGSWPELSEDYQPSMVRQRAYWSFTNKKLEDVLAADLQLAGYYPCLTSTGTIGIKRLELPSPTRQGSRTITVLTGGDAGFPSYERSSLGKHNTLRLFTGYTPGEDEHNGPTITWRDVASFGQSPLSRVVEIKPWSEYKGAPTEPYEEIVSLGARISGVFGGPYQTVRVAVSLKDFSVTVGDTVILTSPQVPDTDGTIGVTEKRAIVLGRDWQPYSARGTLDLLTTDGSIAGYAPAARVSSEVNSSGNTWAITVAATHFPTTFPEADDWFEVGDQVRVWLIASATGTTVDGTVDSVAANVVTVTFEGVWTPGASAWVLGYDTASEPVIESQELFGFVASSVGLIAFTDSEHAREFAP